MSLDRTSPVPRTCPHCLVSFDTPVDIDATKPSQIPIDILNSNRPPTDPEIPSIRSAIAKERARKTCLDARIAAVQSLLNKLIMDRDASKEDIWKLEGTLSPLRQMPTELITLVFKFASRSKLDDGRNTAPWTISQVCHRWRAIVTSQPSFWAFIDLDFERLGSDRISRTKFRLETQLKRSGNLSLHIMFTCRFPTLCTEQESGLLNILANHCARWEKVQISGPLALSSESGLACIRGNVPRLSKLQILFRPPPDEERSLDVFELAPNLREASINMGYLGEPLDVMLPFSGLLQYAARNSWDKHLNVLRSASNLVECALEVVNISMPPAIMVALPRLLRLSLSKSNLLDCLDTPQLEELYCSSVNNHLSSLFKRRQPLRLQKLVLFFPASVTDISTILESVPTITDIGVCVRAGSIDPISTLLTLRNEPTDIALALKSIIISCNEEHVLFQFFNENLLVDMVISRWRGGILRSITVPDSDFSMERDERFQPLKREGLELRLTGSWSRVRPHIDMVPTHLRFNDSYL
ncbi:hypothetical protein B0H13DRAFT_1992179 [Mycena leptocephala]|nr:hypothetical protein B0H13DRAFT_1992179 [Mycena leptocephala]